MSEKSQLVLMAQYNRVMNQRMIAVSKKLSMEALLENKGAFFGSILGTLNHIMIGDILWLKRFSMHPNDYVSLAEIKEFETPSHLGDVLFDNLEEFKITRSRIDNVIAELCKEVKEDDLDEPLIYTNFVGESHSKRFGDLILHVFLHQIHHRGQASTLLSQEKIDFGETDLPEFIPDHDSPIRL